ncbi:MAG: phosphotransferase [Anaerolineales bacterium]|nr:phosphotransferase [Anaerolineales bacterium]
MKPFHQLTGRGMALRLRKMALAALDGYHLDVTRVRLLRNSYNGIFRVDTATGDKYVVRVSLPGERQRKEILAEMTWLDAIKRETDLRVPYPLRTRAGELLTTVEVPGVPEPRHCTVFGWVPGADLAQRISPENLSKVGQFAARLHDHAEDFTPQEGFWLKTYDRVFPNSFEVALFSDPRSDLLPPERRAVFQQAHDRVGAALEKLYARPDKPIVLHADFHQGNIKVYRGQITALDFDDTMLGYPIQDIAISFYYFSRYANFPELRQAYQEGYTALRSWPQDYEGQIELFMAGRGLALTNFLLQHPDPGFQQMLPRFLESEENRMRGWLELA